MMIDTRDLKTVYREWIRDYVASKPSVLGLCKEATQAMIEAFPELRIERGHVYVMGWGKRAHWWCVTIDGEIFDPTKAQFNGMPIFEYEPWKPGDEVRVGKCMECGDEIWMVVETLDTEPPHKSFCNQECEASFMEAEGC